MDRRRALRPLGTVGTCGLRWPEKRAASMAGPICKACVSVTVLLNARECSLTNRYFWQQGSAGISSSKEPSQETGTWAETSGSSVHSHVVSLPQAKPSVPEPRPKRAPCSLARLPSWLEPTLPPAAHPIHRRVTRSSHVYLLSGPHGSILLRLGGGSGQRQVPE